jgi:hypothetical protein
MDIKQEALRRTANGTRSSGNALLDALARVGDFDIQASMDFFYPNPFSKEYMERRLKRHLSVVDPDTRSSADSSGSGASAG